MLLKTDTVKELSYKKITDVFESFLFDMKKVIERNEFYLSEISTSLPILEASISQNHEEVCDFVQLFTSDTISGCTTGIKEDIETFFDSLKDFMEIVTETDKIDSVLFSDLKSTADLSSTTLEKAGLIQEISEELKVFAINSSIYALKSGADGTGYQVIANEFIKISDKISKIASDIKAVKGNADISIGQFSEKLKTLIDNIGKNKNIINGDTKIIIDQTNDGINLFLSILSDIISNLNCIKDPVNNIMVEMQYQDIIQQQFLHITEAMEDIFLVVNQSFKNGICIEKSEDVLILLKTLVSIVVAQLERLKPDYVRLIENLKSNFDVVSDLGIHIKDNKNELLELVNQNDDKSKRSFTELMFKVPIELMRHIEVLQHDGLLSKKTLLKIYKSIYDQLKESVDIYQSLPTQFSRTKQHLMFAKIEQARFNLTINNLGQDSEDNESSGNLFFDLENMSLHQSEFSQTLITMDDVYQKSIIEVDIEAENYLSMVESLNRGLTVISETEIGFEKQYETIIHLIDVLLSYMTEKKLIFKDLFGMESLIDENIEKITMFENYLDEQIESRGINASLDNCSFKNLILKNIVEKCTVKSEREAISSNFADFGIEDSNSSSITLF